MKKLIVLLLALVMLFSMVACSNNYVDGGPTTNKLSETDALKELRSCLDRVGSVGKGNPEVDLTAGTTEAINELPEINQAYPITVDANKGTVVEFWMATEKSGEGNDGWGNDVAKRFNAQYTNGSIKIRSIDPGPSVDYILAGLTPDAWSPANALWHSMIESKGYNISLIEKKLAGNTAGILMKNSVYNDFIAKYQTVTLENVIVAVNNGDFILGFTNPYVSDTALNMLTQVLISLDPTDPLSNKAATGFLELQSKCPPPALNTTQMRESAAKGFIDVMVMERQAYINKTELSDYKFTPFGIRHDNPVSVFDDNMTPEKRQVLNDFIEFCKQPEQQRLATQYGFNNPEDESYQGMPTFEEGSMFFKAQSLWKKNKAGGRQHVTVIVSDRSGSMGDPAAKGSTVTKMDLLQMSLINGFSVIGNDVALGMVSYSDSFTIELEIDNFVGEHKAKAVSAVKAMSPSGGTSSYSAVAIAIDMIMNAKDRYPNAIYSIYLLTDGDVRNGISLDKIAPIIASLDINVNAIGYGSDVKEAELQKLVSYKEGFVQMVDENNVIYGVKTIFNSQF